MTFHHRLPPHIVAEHARERAHLHALRQAIADRIEADIALLDRLDPDPDVEDGADEEPSLGWLTGRSQLPTILAAGYGGGSDRESEDEHDEDGGDREPFLGAPEPLTFGGLLFEFPGGVARHGDQTFWADGGRDDRERDAGDEAEQPGEVFPLGWAEPDVVRTRRAAR